MLHADPDSDSENGKHQAKGTAGRPEQEQTQQSEYSGNSIEQNDDLPMRQPMLKEFVMNVLAIGGKDRTTADQAAHDRERGFQNGQAERHDWNRDGDDRWRF